jgi:hypothetical protein
MVFIQNLNKFRIATKNTKDIEFINSICTGQQPNDLLFHIYF